MGKTGGAGYACLAAKERVEHSIALTGAYKSNVPTVSEPLDPLVAIQTAVSYRRFYYCNFILNDGLYIHTKSIIF
jgi:hypothetical protein